MAVWQYDIALVPRAGVVRQHGNIPAELPGYRAVWNPESESEQPSPNYWAGVAPESFSEEIEAILPPCPSWSADALMYGVEDGHTIKIWKGEEITFRFDVRTPDVDLLRSIVDFARRHDLLLVPDTKGQPFEPSLEAIIEDLRSSDACGFCKDPESYLRSLEMRQDSEPGAAGNSRPAEQSSGS
jgi:hypothetical protein